jgi:hypothetical protein
MTNGWMSKLNQQKQSELAQNRLADKSPDYEQMRPADLAPSYHNRDLKTYGCKHYKRASKLQGHCCGRWFACRFCHDEVSDHNIVRYVDLFCFFLENSLIL